MVDELHDLLGTLGAPWEQKCRGLFEGLQGGPCFKWEDITSIAGLCSTIGVNSIYAHLATFVPGKGFAFEAGPECEIVIPGVHERALSFGQGDRFLCNGKLVQVNAAKWETDSQAVVIPFPVFCMESQWHAIHLFSGAFAGWTQAFNQIPRLLEDFLIGSQLHGDSDLEVAQAWVHRTGQTYYATPLLPRSVVDPATNKFVHGEVKDYYFLHLAGHPANVVFTASPPCVSWSRGGRQHGLASIFGQVFLQAIMTCGLAQPIILALECAAEVPTNPHFRIVRTLLEQLGFRCLWNDICSLHTLSHTTRNRWLGVWVRADVFRGPIPPPVMPSPTFREEWFEQIYNFVIPRVVKEQLVLTPSERTIYGDINLLPDTKREGLPTNATVEQVLKARELSLHQPLPTLCASYSSQHLLSSRHIQERGIFASLTCQDGLHAFVDPFRFMSLFGIVDSVAISAKVALAFKQIGNAIAVPHALLVLLSGISAVTNQAVDVSAAILRVWCRRINSYTGFIVQGDRFHVLCSAVDAIQTVSLLPPTVPVGVTVLQLEVLHAPSVVRHSLVVPAQWTVGHLLQIFRWQFDIAPHLFLSCPDERIHNGHALLHIVSLSRSWHLYLANRLLAVLTFGRSVVLEPLPEQPPDPDGHSVQVIHDSQSVASPTLPYSVAADGKASTQCGSFEGIVHSEPFLHAVRTAEECLRRNRPVCTGFHVFREPPSGFTMPVPELDVDHVTLPLTKRCKRVDSKCTAHVIVTDADDCTPVAFPPVIVARMPSGDFQFLQVTSAVSNSDSLLVDGKPFRISALNGCHFDSAKSCIAHGDVVELVAPALPIVHAGGHHGAQPISLPAGADFGSRCEFAINTSGWLATDEMRYFVECIQWTNAAYAQFAPIVTWDMQMLDFDDSTYQEIIIPNYRLTVIPVLCGAHWAAVEVLKAGPRTSVTVIAFPGPLVQNVVFAVARIMDFNPSHLNVQHVILPDREHFCGWQLLARWMSHANVLQQIPADDDGYNQTPLDKRHLIDEVVVTAIDDWHNAGIPVEEWTLAARLRRAFFAHLASHHGPPVPVTTERLFVSFVDSQNPAPPRTQAALVHQNILPDLAVLRRLFDTALDALRPFFVNTYFAPPAVWNSENDTLDFLDGRTPDTWFHPYVIWPVIIDATWVLLEMVRDAAFPVTVFMSAPQSFAHHMPDIVGHLARIHAIAPLSIQQVFVPFQTPQHMCGWTLLESIYIRHHSALPDSSMAASHIFASSRHHEIAQEIRLNSSRAWMDSGASESTVDLAFDVRSAFLLRILEGRVASTYACAGGEHDEPMPLAGSAPATKAKPPSVSKNAPDPWLESDPWNRRQKKLPTTKWEDLVLPDQHPIVDDKGGLLPQTHKLQASARKAGVILATKGAIADLMRLSFEGPTALVLPASEKLTGSDLGKKLIGPHELVLHDPALQCEYKRLIVLLPLFSTVKYSLPTPKITMSATAVVELVAEVDSRLLTGIEHDTVKVDPLKFIRDALSHLHSALKEELAFYALRIGHHPAATRNEPQYQCLVKVPKKHRAVLLQSSGLTPVLVRDFFDQSSQPTDVSVVPRFWSTTPRDLNDARIILKDVQGFAGLVVTKRGLATRAWDSEIAAVRAAVLPNDIRLTKENMDIVPRFQFSSTGWPAAIEPKCVAQSTVQAVGLAPVPSKAFRTNGVFGWVLGFAARPSVLRFTLNINGSTFEILLVEEDRTSLVKPPTKAFRWKKDKYPGEGKGPPSAASGAPVAMPFVPAPVNSQDSQRIQALEQRFDKLESRQSRMEEKMDSRFSDISDSLRQLLQASAAHPRDTSGETPNPKHPRRDDHL